jgi:glycosyltransferase involved in cell wall biosynthesis
MDRPGITVTIVTLNEEKNIQRAVSSARWAEEVLVVDSGSKDRTVEIAKAAGARVIHNPWRGYGQQKNFAQDQAAHDWVLNIDADEEIPDSLAREIQTSMASAETQGIRGFSVARKTWYLGRWIMHGGWYPNVLARMADRRHARWSEPRVHEALEIRGQVARLNHPLHHFTFEGIRDQIETNLMYSRFGYDDLVRKGRRPSLPLLLLKPCGKFIETYFFKRGFMDGLPGLIISINAAHSMFLKYAYFFEDRERK